MQEMRVWSLSREDPLEKEMATHSSILSWKIPWTESLVGYSPQGYKESDMIEHTRGSQVRHDSYRAVTSRTSNNWIKFPPFSLTQRQKYYHRYDCLLPVFFLSFFFFSSWRFLISLFLGEYLVHLLVLFPILSQRIFVVFFVSLPPYLSVYEFLF